MRRDFTFLILPTRVREILSQVLTVFKVVKNRRRSKIRFFRTIILIRPRLEVVQSLTKNPTKIFQNPQQSKFKTLLNPGLSAEIRNYPRRPNLSKPYHQNPTIPWKKITRKIAHKIRKNLF